MLGVLTGLMFALYPDPSHANCQLRRDWNDRIRNFEIMPGNVLKVGKLEFKLFGKIKRDEDGYLIHDGIPFNAVLFARNDSRESPYTIYSISGQLINIAWLHDRQTGRLTKVYEDHDRPLITTEWFGKKTFAVLKQSIHLVIAYVINVENSSKISEIFDFLDYNRESRIYVKLKFLALGTDHIAVGRDLFRKESEEVFELPDLGRPRFSRLKCVFIRKDHVEIIFMNKQYKRTTRKFHPKFMQAKK